MEETLLSLCSRTLSCLDRLAPGRGLADISRANPRFLKNFFSKAGRGYLDNHIVIGKHFEDLSALMQLDGGTATIAAVVDAHLNGRPTPSHQEIGGGFRFSASQARKILKAAESKGLLRFSADGRVEDASGLVEVFQRFQARELALYAKYVFDLETYFVPA